MTDEELDALERLCEAAAPGPWTVGTIGQIQIPDRYAGQRDGWAESRFIAAARTAVPALVREVRQLREELELCVGAIRALGGLPPLGHEQPDDPEKPR